MASTPSSHTDQLVDQVAEMKRTLGQFARLIEISLTLNSTLDLDRMLEFIIGSTTDILDCEAAAILLYDDKNERLYFAASTGSDPEKLAEIPVPIDSSIAGRIFTTGSPEIVNDLNQDPRHFQKAGEEVEFVTRSLIGVPMHIRENVIGVIEGLNHLDGPFTQHDVDILMVIASQAAVAINNTRIMNDLQKAYEDLSQIDEIKSEFIAIASHELRTPLLHILGYAQMLQEETEGESDNVSRVVDSAMKLRILVDEMTNMNLLEMRSQELHWEQADVQQILMDAYQEIAQTLKTKGHTSQFDLPKEPLYVRADPEKLGQAFVNVFSNAARFTPENGVIKIGLEQRSNQVHITIQDNGIGIPETELESVFDRFYQVESHLTRSESGMGLGLPISRGLVELHEGKVWAESGGENQGTAIHITLPLLGA